MIITSWDHGLLIIGGGIFTAAAVSRCATGEVFDNAMAR
jgi:hypothetical protein